MTNNANLHELNRQRKDKLREINNLSNNMSPKNIENINSLLRESRQLLFEMDSLGEFDSPYAIMVD